MELYLRKSAKSYLILLDMVYSRRNTLIYIYDVDYESDLINFRVNVKSHPKNHKLLRRYVL